MIFYHHTTEEAAESILSTKKGLGITGSEYYIVEYVRFLLSEKLEVPTDPVNGSIKLKSEYIIKIDSPDGSAEKPTEKKFYAKWLGKGLYCFSPTNFDAARQYGGENLTRVLMIHVDDKLCSEADIFSMNNRANRYALHDFLNDMATTVKPLIFSDQSEEFDKLIEILKIAFNNDFNKVPHAAGLLLELYLKINPDYKIVKGIFKLGGSKRQPITWTDEYVSIRDLSIIEKVTEADEYGMAKKV